MTQLHPEKRAIRNTVVAISWTLLSFTASADDAARITLQDRADILELVAKYSFTWDAAD